MRAIMFVVLLVFCGCGSGPFAQATLGVARARCDDSKMAGSGRPMTESEWSDLVATHERALAKGLSYDNAIAFGNLTCAFNPLCVECNVALVDALWP